MNRRSLARVGLLSVFGLVLVATPLALQHGQRPQNPAVDSAVENDQLRPNLASSTGSCGVERWSVKTGTDADTGLVNLGSVTQTSIGTMRSYAKPATLPANNRISPQETTLYSIDATLTEYKLETDSDYHLVIQDSSGTMITEIPDPACAGGSAFASGIQSARNEFDAAYNPTSTFKFANIPVRVRGIGFFDFLHGQTGVAPNGIELHPVLDIIFNPGPINVGVPGTPTSVVATGGDGAATVTWSAPASDGGAAITSYTVTPYTSSGAQAPQTVTAPAASATITGLANGTTYWFTVAATNSVGTGAAASSYSVTPASSATPPARLTAVSTNQYLLPMSDGALWQDMDGTNLSLSFTPSATGVAIISANSDLWTAAPGYNQDLGIWLQAGGSASSVVAWKESGGFAGTFSPNAAMVQTAIPVSASTTYIVKLDWKTNKPAMGVTIYAGAGPIASQFSPTRLSVQLIASTNFSSTASLQQYTLAGSDGATWQSIDATNLDAPLTPTSSGEAIVSANADLWTANAGYNQDLGVFVSVDGGADVLVAWKESGGFAGTYSPNAAFVQANYSVSSSSSYVFKLKWKTNRNAPGVSIFAGAGPIGSAYSPTRLTVHLLDSANDFGSSATKQYHLTGSDGATWAELDSNLRVTPTPGVTATLLLAANADLWTANAGYNQDIGIFVSVNGGADQLLAWKESGGFAGTFSPNAAFVEGVYAMSAGSTYVFKLKWKTNKSALGATIFAGAGPIAGLFSPTSLTAQILS